MELARCTLVLLGDSDRREKARRREAASFVRWRSGVLWDMGYRLQVLVRM
jgi:hypothetical protein